MASENEESRHRTLWIKSTTLVLWLSSWKSDLVQYTGLREEDIHCGRSQVSEGAHGIHRNTILHIRLMSKYTCGTQGDISTLYYSTMPRTCSETDSYLSHEKPKEPSRKRTPKLSAYTKLSDPEIFPKDWEAWKQTYQDYINEKSIKPNGWWKYTHTNLRKAINLINNALPYMFQPHNHTNPNIEQSSNKIEWYFWVFAEEWIKEHKWLAPPRLYAFTSFWIYLKNQK